MKLLFPILALLLALTAWAGSTTVYVDPSCPNSLVGERIPNEHLDLKLLAKQLREAGYVPATEHFTMLFSGGEAILLLAKKGEQWKVIKYPMLRGRQGSSRHEVTLLERVNRREREINATEADPVYYFPEGRIVRIGDVDCIEFDFIARSAKEPALRARSLWEVMHQDYFDFYSMVTVMRHLMRAVPRIHQAGVIHRDLKVDNVLVLEGEREVEDTPGKMVWTVVGIKVLDFGLAALPGEYPEGLAQATGTLEGMSGPQLLGRPAAEIDDRIGIGRLFMDLAYGKKRAYGEGAASAPHVFRRPTSRTDLWLDYRRAPEDELENKALAIAIASSWPESVVDYFALIKSALRVQPDGLDAFCVEYGSLLRKAPVVAIMRAGGGGSIVPAIYHDSTALYNILRSKTLIARFFKELGFEGRFASTRERERDRARDEIIRAFYLRQRQVFPQGRDNPPRELKQGDVFHPYLYWAEFEARLEALRATQEVLPELEYWRQMRRRPPS